MDEASIAALVQRARANDPDAYAEIYRQFRPRVLGLCRYMLGSVEEAEDAVGDIFARLPKAMKSYDLALPFSRWLLSVASHHCVDVLRKRGSMQRLVEPMEEGAPEPVASAPSPLDEVVAREQRKRVREALMSLRESYRAPLALRYYNDLSYDEIAGQLGLTRSQVAILIFRGKQELRRKLASLREPKP